MSEGGVNAGYKVRGTKVVSPYPVSLTPAEYRLVFSLQKYFAPEMIWADYYLPKTRTSELHSRNVAEAGLTRADLLQIDCIAVNQKGVFVFESKDYVGWIYGHGDRVHWTQVSAYGQNKHQFYNPIRQNMGHVKAVRELCGEDMPIYSVIVFGREATLKVLTDVPEGCIICTQTELYGILNSLAVEQKLSELDIQTARCSLEAGRINPDTGIRMEHIEEVKKYGSRFS